MMENQGTIDPFPQVLVLDRHHLPEEFPAPAVLSPLPDPVSNSLAHVCAGRNEYNVGRLIECLQTADNRQQLKPLATEVPFELVRFQTLRAVSRSQDKPPLPSPRALT
jgi:hypothetical protein